VTDTFSDLAKYLMIRNVAQSLRQLSFLLSNTTRFLDCLKKLASDF